ncbi:hypothetical protein [Glaciihabitans sp. UYNi722]|uniref:hypothetical protein n=1 Tax=Glaciihabitans sp. UYNi722 TaxID=3156344 RepID=UPI003396426F
MTTLPGRWALQMRTPIGSIKAEMTFTGDAYGFAGTAVGKTETVELQNIRVVTDVDGEHVTWNQTITKPMRLNLEFDVIIAGDDMHGHSRAGRLPKSIVTGHHTND